MHPENKLTLPRPEGINDRNEMVHWVCHLENNSAQYRSEERITRGWCLLQYKVQTGKRDFNWEDAPLILSCSVCLGCTHSISKFSVCISGFKLTWRFFYCPVEYV